MLGFSSLTTSPTWVGCDVYLVHHIYGQFQIMLWKFPISDQELRLGNPPPQLIAVQYFFVVWVRKYDDKYATSPTKNPIL